MRCDLSSTFAKDTEMANGDQSERVAIAQALMADVTVRLEDLAGLAADLQLSLNSSPSLLDGVSAVHDLVKAHGRLLPAPRPKPTRAKRTT